MKRGRQILTIDTEIEDLPDEVVNLCRELVNLILNDLGLNSTDIAGIY